MQPARSPSQYPATLDLRPAEEIARWRPLVHWFLAIPHYVVLYVLNLVSSGCALVGWFTILFTGTLWAGVADVQAMTQRYAQRVAAYVLFLREEYPPFSFEVSSADPGDDPRLRVDITPQLTDRNRVTTFFRLLLVLPHAFVLAALGLGASVAAFVGAVAVLVTGRWPEGLRTFVIGVMRWALRVNAYQLVLVDDYPPFSLE